MKKIRAIGIKLLFIFVLVILITGSLAGTFLGGNQAQAASSVTLNASSYADPDAEDAHIASQWVVRDAGSTIFNSGTDAANLTLITLAGSYFTDGTTYFWKVRYQDEHSAWSPYSAEASFVYHDADISVTPTSTSTTTATATTTATTTITSSTSVTPGCTANSCVADIRFGGGEGDAESNGGGEYDCETGFLTFSSMMYNSKIEAVSGQTLNDNIPGVISDIYIAFEENSNYYKRIENDINYTESYQWVTLPGYSWSYLSSTVKVKIPATLIAQYPSSKKIRLLLHAYESVGQSWGNSLSLVAGWTEYANPTDMASRSNWSGIDCTIEITDDIIDKPCLMEIVSPKNNDIWLVGSQYDAVWKTDEQYSDKIPKLSIALSRDGGKTVSDPLLMRGDNLGLFKVGAIERYTSNKAVLQFIGLDRDGDPVSFCQSERFKIKGQFGFGGSSGGLLSTILFLGALLSSIPLLLMLIAMIPSISRLLSRLGMLFMPPAWPNEKPAWGVVYDAVSKKPIHRAILRIFSEPGGKQRDIQTSNERGEFGFLVPRGKYSIVVSASGYNFPSHILSADTDGKYTHLYRGGEVSVATSTKESIEKAPLNINIPMDPSRLPVLDIAIVGFLSVVHKFTSTIRYPVMIIGTLASIYLAVKYGRFIDWLILVLYVLLWALEVRDIFKKRTYGVIVDEKGNPVPLAIVRVMDMHGKIITTAVTGDDGKFLASVSQGAYRFDVVKSGYNTTRSRPYQISKMQDLHRVKLLIEKIAKSEGAIQYRTNISS